MKQEETNEGDEQTKEFIIRVLKDVGKGMTEDQICEGLQKVREMETCSMLKTLIEKKQVDAILEDGKVAYCEGTGKGAHLCQEDIDRSTSDYRFWVVQMKLGYPATPNPGRGEFLNPLIPGHPQQMASCFLNSLEAGHNHQIGDEELPSLETLEIGEILREKIQGIPEKVVDLVASFL